MDEVREKVSSTQLGMKTYLVVKNPAARNPVSLYAEIHNEVKFY